MIEINLLPHPPPGYVRVRIALDLEADEFERSQIGALKIGLAHFLQLEPAMLRTAAIVRWNPRIDLDMPESEARQLASFAEANPVLVACLGPLPIRSIRLESPPDVPDESPPDVLEEAPSDVPEEAGPVRRSDSLFLRVLRYAGYLLLGVSALWLVGSVIEGDPGILIAAVLLLTAGGGLVLIGRRT